MNIPKIIAGDISVDDRGEVAYVNEFDFADVKRFYRVSNHRKGFVRAWHAHRQEAKYVVVMRGVALVGAVAIDNWEHPSRQEKVYRYVLSAKKPEVLYIPSSYANGFMSLTDDAILVFFSTKTIEESLKDDVRYVWNYWDIWQVEER